MHRSTPNPSHPPRSSDEDADDDAEQAGGAERRPLMADSIAQAAAAAAAQAAAATVAASSAGAAVSPVHSSSSSSSSSSLLSPASSAAAALALSGLHVKLPHHRGSGGGGGGNGVGGGGILLPASLIPLSTMMMEDSPAPSGGGTAAAQRLMAGSRSSGGGGSGVLGLRRGSLGGSGNLSVGGAAGSGTASQPLSPREGPIGSLLFGSSAMLLHDPSSGSASRATSNSVAGGGGGAPSHHLRRSSFDHGTGGSVSGGGAGSLGSYAREFVAWLTADTPRALPSSTTTQSPHPAAMSSYPLATMPHAHASDEDAAERGEHADDSTFSHGSAAASLSSSASPPQSPEPVSAASACLSHTIWLSFALVLLFLVVFAAEWRSDAADRHSRLTLLGVPQGDASRHVHVDSTAVPTVTSPSSLLQLSSAPPSPSPSDAADPHDSLISLHESAVLRQKELNKHLQALSDRESKIHFLTGELARTSRVMQSYKKIVARLKALQVEHAEMERRVAADNQKQIAAQLASETLLFGGGAGSGGGAGGNGGGVGAVTPVTPVDLAKYRSRLLSLIFGNKTLDESRRERDGILQGLGAHSKEITALVEQEKEAQSLAMRAGQHEGFLSRAANKIAGNAAPDQTQVAVESVMRVQELEGHLGGGGDFDDETDKAHSAAEGGSTPAGQAASDGGPDSPGGAAAAGGGSSPSSSSPSSKAKLSPADKLVDSDKNEYILSKPGNGPGSAGGGKTVDTRLVMDLGVVIIASALGGLLASLLRQPILLGYLVGGSAIGPGGLKLIGQFIQIETLAQFGATFLLFALGVEFSVAKLRRVKHIALFGGALQLALIMLLSFLGGSVWLLELRAKQSLFIGAVVSMSSTTVVVKALMESKQIGTLCGQVMLGLLIVQDLFLSLMLALLNLARVPWDHLATESAWLGVRFLFLGSIVLACMYLWPLVLRMLDHSRSSDLFLLGLTALCIFLTVISEKVIHSAEVGAFLSGILISSSPGASAELSHRSLKLFAPIRDMFGALFFSSIGMLINPAFLIDKAATILLLVALTMLLKSLLTLCIVRAFGYSFEIAIRAGMGLSQVGEFAFVLASEGMRVGLIQRDMYFLLLGTTAVSIFVTPFILKLSLWIVRTCNMQDHKVHAQGMQVD